MADNAPNPHRRYAVICKFRTYFVLVVLLLSLVSSACAQDAAPPRTSLYEGTATPLAQAIEQARARATRFAAENGLTGLSVAVLVDQRVVWAEGFGLADVEQGVPVTPLSRFRIGSISKPVTAAALARLVEQGKLDLDAPVQRYVPDFPEKRWPITTRQLAGHLAGVRHYKGEEFLIDEHYDTVRAGLAVFEKDPLEHEPGTKFRYSSYGWNLLSAVLEGAAGQPFLTLMDNEVMDPLALHSIVADEPYELVRHRVRFYQRREDGALRNGAFVDNSLKWAGGGFLGTPSDLVRFMAAHWDGEYLKPATVAELFTSQKTKDGKETGYGIGWTLDRAPDGRRWVGHGGGSIGGISLLYGYPEEKIAIALTTNVSPAPIDPAIASELLAPFLAMR